MLLKARPSTTLMTSSRLLSEKNQKEPVSPVIGTALARPKVPWEGTRQATWTRNRPAFKQSVEREAAHAGAPGWAAYVKAPARSPEPTELETTMSTIPAAWAGMTAVRKPGSSTVTAAATPPKVTAVSPVKLNP